MNLATMLLILILMWVAPFLIIPALTLLALAAFVWLLMQISVLLFQGALVLTAFAIKKCGLYREDRQATQAGQLMLAEPVEPIEEPKT